MNPKLFPYASDARKTDFLWGVATAAFQVEGALTEGGRSPSIWDAFCAVPGAITDGSRPDIACNSYHQPEADIQALRELGVNAYRFSISWSRIIPGGRGKINPNGIAYYQKLLDLLEANGITPMVTLYHWDLPLELHTSGDGWLNRATAHDFAAYAEVCFREFGNRVRYWCTLNEPWCSAVLGYGQGVFPPAHSNPQEAYIAAHHLLLAHGEAVQKFRDGGYPGTIGMALNCDWREPLTDTPEDREAAERALDFFYGWFGDPVVYGDYPGRMRERLGERLPTFSAAEKKLLQNSVDYLGLNHYTTLYASATPPTGKADIGSCGNGGLSEDQGVFLSADPDWEFNGMQWGIVPDGFRKMLNWLAKRYPKLPIYVTENGCTCREPDPEIALDDRQRCRYLKGYINAMQQAIRIDGCPVRGYFCWTLADNFEWVHGYSKRAGLFRCDPDDLRRRPKRSADCFREIIRTWAEKPVFCNFTGRFETDLPERRPAEYESIKGVIKNAVPDEISFKAP